MAALISLARAAELIPNFPSNDSPIMEDIVQSCSALIQTWCNRTFATQAYDELYDGTGHTNLLVNNYPILSIDRVLFNPVQVLMIQFLDTDQSVSRASFRLDGTSDVPPKPNNLYLEWVDNGVLNQQTIALASYVKLSDLAAAVNVYSSSGWKATALGVYGNFRVQDLRPPQGAFETRWFGSAYLWMHTFAQPQYYFRQETGEIVAPQGWMRGYQNFRLLYTAGYSTVPLDVQQACGELAAAVYLARNQNPNLASESLGGYSWSALTDKTFNNLSISSRYALYQYRQTRIVKFTAIP